MDARYVNLFSEKRVRTSSFFEYKDLSTRFIKNPLINLERKKFFLIFIISQHFL
jgi:hypothetical protein